MSMFRKILYLVLAILTGLLALSGLAGGLGLLFGFSAPPIEALGNSIFKDYTVPGLALFVLVGGSALLAFVLLTRQSKDALLFATTAGIVIMFFVFVEILIIGSPPGVSQTLQIFYFGLGTVITIFAMGVWYLDLREQQPPV